MVDVGVLGGDLVEGALPQVAGKGQDVGLVDQGEMAAPRLGQVEGEPDTALHPEAGVHRALRGHLGGGAFAQEPTLARVGPLGVLPDDGKVDRHAGADAGLRPNGRRLM